MGKLIDKLEAVGQGSSSGFGFLNSRGTTQKPRPAAVFARLAVSDAAAAQSLLDAGADGLLLTDWQPGADLSTVKSAAEAKKAIWGVEGAEGAHAPEGSSLTEAAQEAGAAFLVLTPTSPASELFASHEQVDVVGAFELPHDDMGLLLFRAQTSVPVRAALFEVNSRAADLARVTLTEASRMAVVFRSLPFAVILQLPEPPDATGARTLVRLGADAFVLAATSATAAQVGEQIQTLRSTLESVPTRDEDRSTPSVGGLLGTQGPATTAPQREPKPDPEHE